jgi:hypothetical protein
VTACDGADDCDFDAAAYVNYAFAIIFKHGDPSCYGGDTFRLSFNDDFFLSPKFIFEGDPRVT